MKIIKKRFTLYNKYFLRIEFREHETKSFIAFATNKDPK